MKILYHHRIASKDGQYVHVEELTNALLDQGHDIIFVCPGFSKSTEFGNEGGIAKKLKALLPKWTYELLELSYALVIAVKLVQAILKHRPDFIYERYNLYQPAGVIVAKFFSLPILLEINAPLAYERQQYSGLSLIRFAKFIECFTWKNASYVLPVTSVLAKTIVAAGVAKEKIEVIPNGVNNYVYEKITKELKNRKKTEQIVIGFTGFLNQWHRLDLALQAIAELKGKDIRFICVGEGGVRSELENQAYRLGIESKVEFTGLIGRDKVFECIKKFDISLQPSVTPYASPLKLFEYLAVGSVVIAPNTDNILEVLDEKNAVLFDPEKKDDFKNKLLYAIENFSLLKVMRTEARRTIIKKNLTWQFNAKKVIELVCSDTMGEKLSNG